MTSRRPPNLGRGIAKVEYKGFASIREDQEVIVQTRSDGAMMRDACGAAPIGLTSAAEIVSSHTIECANPPALTPIKNEAPRNLGASSFFGAGRGSAQHPYFTDLIAALHRANANCPAPVAGTQHDLPDGPLAGFETMAAGAATLHNESLKVAEAVEDDFDNLADAMLLSGGVRAFSRAHGPAVKRRRNGGGIASRSVDSGRQVLDLSLDDRVPAVERRHLLQSPLEYSQGVFIAREQICLGRDGNGHLERPSYHADGTQDGRPCAPGAVCFG